MEAVKGLRGYWHATNGDWFDGNSLKAFCNKGIPPNYRRFKEQDVKRVVDCPQCRVALAKWGS